MSYYFYICKYPDNTKRTTELTRHCHICSLFSLRDRGHCRCGDPAMKMFSPFPSVHPHTWSCVQFSGCLEGLVFNSLAVLEVLCSILWLSWRSCVQFSGYLGGLVFNSLAVLEVLCSILWLSWSSCVQFSGYLGGLVFNSLAILEVLCSNLWLSWWYYVQFSGYLCGLVSRSLSILEVLCSILWLSCLPPPIS